MTKDEYAFRQALKARFPLFGKRPHVPLMIGVREELLKVLAPEAKEEKKQILRFLSFWVKSVKYLHAIAAGGPRYDLELNPVGEVTDEQRRYAAIQYLFQHERMVKKAQHDPECVIPALPEAIKAFEADFEEAKKNQKPVLTKAQKAAKHAALLAKQKADKEARIAAKKAAQKAAKQKSEKPKPDTKEAVASKQAPEAKPKKLKAKAPVVPTVVVKKRRRVVVPS